MTHIAPPHENRGIETTREMVDRLVNMMYCLKPMGKDSGDDNSEWNDQPLADYIGLDYE
jgi:hypothetical protein